MDPNIVPSGVESVGHSNDYATHKDVINFTIAAGIKDEVVRW